MKRAFFATVAIAALASACGSPPQVNWAGPTSDDVTPRLLAAMKEEAIGDPNKAAAMYVDLMEDAVYASPWDVAVLEASVDALMTRDVAGLSEFSERTALAYRLRDAAFYDANKPDLLTKHMPGVFHDELDS